MRSVSGIQDDTVYKRLFIATKMKVFSSNCGIVLELVFSRNDSGVGGFVILVYCDTLGKPPVICTNSPILHCKSFLFLLHAERDVAPW